MKKLTSELTFFNKRIFPVIWFGGLGVFVLAGIFSDGDAPKTALFIIPVFMAVFGYFIMKKLVFDLIDEVYDEGSSILFINGKTQVRVDLSDIKNVNYITYMNPPRVTISLRYETELGSELTFSPPGKFIPFAKDKDIEDLIDRIDEARR